MKLIHCADLHLDSPLSAHLTREQARERRQELLTACKQMTDFAVTEGVRAILISGDLFDSNRVTKTTLHFIDDLILSHPEIDFLYLRGNHDPQAFWESFESTVPDNLKLFDASWTSYRYESVVVTGAELSPENKGRIFGELVLSQEDVNIVMLHGQLSTAKAKDKTEIIPVREMKNRYIDYLALGHLHEYEQGRLDTRGIWCYSGCLQGRGFDECGQKGFVLLDIKDGKVESSFVPLNQRTCEEISVDISDAQTSPEVLHCIEEAIRDIPDTSLVSIRLVGEQDVDVEKNLAYLLEQIRGCFYYCQIKDRTRLKISYDQYRLDKSLKGEFIRLMEQAKVREEEKDTIIRMGLKALAGEEPTE